MRPFICSLLKCNSCGSESIPRATIEKYTKIKLPSYHPNIQQFRNEQAFISDLIEDISKNRNSVCTENPIKISEEDLYIFMESADPNDELKIVELLYGIDIIKGNITCSQCGVVRSIEEGILRYE